MKSTFSILLFIDKSKTDHEGLCTIRCRISCNSSSVSLSTAQKCLAKHWDAKGGCVKKLVPDAVSLNNTLATMRSDIRILYEETLRKESYITADYIKQLYIDRQKPSMTLLSLYQAICNHKQELQGKTLAKETVRAFKDSSRSFERFLQSKEMSDCAITALDQSLIESYRLYMLGTLGYKSSSVSMRLRHLHQVVRTAMREGYLRTDPFEFVDIEKPTYERNALTADDLRKLLAYRPHRSKENHYRLIFLFGCFTGLAFSDIKKLHLEDILPFREGKRYISLARTKTQNRCIIPLLPIAEEIIACMTNSRTSGLIFRDFPLNCTFNRMMRKIITDASIAPTTEATSHTARHTFATTICLENRLPIETVSKMLGHRYISTTEIYAKVSKSKIAKEMRPLLKGSEQTRTIQQAMQICPKRGSDKESV